MAGVGVRIALVAGLAGLVGAPLAAQSCTTNPCTVNGTITVSVGTTYRLLLSATSTTLTPPTLAAFAAGHQDNVGPSLTVSANRPWQVSISPAAATWTGSGGASTTKAASDLTWALAVAGPYQALSGSANLFSGTQGATASRSAQMYYRTLWSLSADQPGTYTLAVVFTITAP